MIEDKNSIWLDSVLKTHTRLTESVITVFENLLKANGIDFLTVTGRTKDKKSALEKIIRKGYKTPEKQMTDLSGIRVILYFESDVNRVSELISNSFGVDVENSLDKSKVLLKDQIGYRSVHFVCTLGNDRAMLPEYSKLTNLKFEVQVRTVLQHAWAELAHDSNYKFSGSLPPEIERKLYLYAGMLEVADKGFDELSSQIDSYKQAIDEQSKLGDFSATIDSISLKEYFDCWADDNDIALENNQKNTSCLIHELNAFGVQTVEDLIDIIPNGYVEAYKEVGEISNIFGIVRDWMLISDWQKFLNNVSFNWMIDRAALKILSKFINGDNLISMLNILDEYGALILDVPYAEHLAEKQLAEQTV